jgi:bacteriocin biosynthesis cyclodehydratase domain-containing protein
MPANPSLAPSGRYYAIAPGIDVVPLPGGDVVLRSDIAAVRLEGGSVELVVHQVLPLLDGRRTVQDVASEIPDMAEDQLGEMLDQLATSGVLVRHAAPTGRPDHPLLALVEQLGLAVDDSRSRLAATTVALVGLDGPGARLAVDLAACGIGRLRLIDPFLAATAELPLLGMISPDAAGRPRDQLVGEAIGQLGIDVDVAVAPATADFGPRPVREAVEGADIVVASYDKGMVAAHHWVNRSALDLRVPALHVRIATHRVEIGPLVVVGQTACFLCWRMRDIASADDFDAAMGYEEYLDRHRQPEAHRRPALPTIASLAAAHAGSEVLKYVLGLGTSTLAGRVLETDVLTLSSRIHEVLRRPDCPACRGKASAGLSPASTD